MVLFWILSPVLTAMHKDMTLIVCIRKMYTYVGIKSTDNDHGSQT